MPFNASTGQVTGAEISVVQGLGIEPLSGLAHYAVSRDGTLFYWDGAGDRSSNHLMWVARDGKAQPVGAPGHDYWDPRVSPDGKHVAALIREGGNDIWHYEIARDTLTRVTFDADEDETPAWSPDGKWLAYSSSRNGKRLVFRRLADGSGPEQE